MNKFFRNILILCLVCLSANASFGQEKEIKQANKDFDKFAYIDARAIYLKVVEDGYESAEIFQRLGDTYYYNSDYENAAKWYTKLVGQYPDQTEPEYFYRAAQSLKSLNQYEESDALMKKYIASGGKGMIVQNFEKDPNYLNSIAFQAKKYTLEKVAINSTGSDFGPAFFGNQLVYASSNKTTGNKIADWNDQPFLDLFMADMDSVGKLSNPRALQGDINTEYHESTPAFTKDGKIVYFTRNNFLAGKAGKDKEKTIRLKLYKASLNDDGKWGDIVELPFNNKAYSTAHPTLSNDEKRLYFSSDMPGTIGSSDLWYVDITGENTYGKPTNLGPDINTEGRESFPFMSKDNHLYYSSDGRAGLGGFDIYVAKLDESGKPSEIKNLGEPANSNYDDFAFIINNDKHIGFLSSNRDGGRGSIDDEIYRIMEKCEITITGLVTDEETGDLLPGAEASLLDENNKLITSVIVGEDGRYTFTADCDKQYTVRGTKDGYNPYEKVVQSPKVTGKIEVPLPLKRIDPCPPNDLGCRLNLQPIYFDFDRYNIRPDAEVELAKILAALREYPQISIDMESHTDSRGSDKYNELLSEKRAQSTLNWLVKKGIDRSRLSAKGYGEYRLVNQCSNGVDCTEAEHQLNRRSMFIIKN